MTKAVRFLSNSFNWMCVLVSPFQTSIHQSFLSKNFVIHRRKTFCPLFVGVSCSWAPVIDVSEIRLIGGHSFRLSSIGSHMVVQYTVRGCWSFLIIRQKRVTVPLPCSSDTNGCDLNVALYTYLSGRTRTIAFYKALDAHDVI